MVPPGFPVVAGSPDWDSQAVVQEPPVAAARVVDWAQAEMARFAGMGPVVERPQADFGPVADFLQAGIEQIAECRRFHW